MEIEVFVKSRKHLEDTSSAQIDVYTPPYHLIHPHSDNGGIYLEKTIKDVLCEEDQLAIGRLAVAIEISESYNCQVVIKDSRHAVNFLEIWLKYNTLKTPLIVIGNQIFKDIPSILELLEAILTPRFETYNWGITNEMEEEYDDVITGPVYEPEKTDQQLN